MSESDKQLIDSLRHAAKRPKSWDVPGLLEDAAARLEVLADMPDMFRAAMNFNGREDQE